MAEPASPNRPGNHQPGGPPSDETVAALDRLRSAKEDVTHQLRRRIIGQDAVVRQVLTALFAGGHCLITGVPGLAKTLLIRTLGEVLDLSYKRIQFTPDLMPSDITGIEVMEEDPASGRREMRFVEGPVFANIILADEINRTPPKTQAALLEAMQEYQVTAGGVRRPLARPFFVLATRNPIEQGGTYALPEAQLDRFMFNVTIDYLSAEEELEVALATTAKEEEPVQPVLSGEEVLAFQHVVRKVYVPQNVAQFAVDLVRATRPGNAAAPPFVQEWVNWGAGLRATQYLLLGGKVRAAFRGRYNVAIEDLRALALPVLRHRVLTNFYAESEGVSVEDVVIRLLGEIREPTSQLV